MTKISVEDYNPAWITSFNLLKQTIWPAVKDFAIAIEHVGSTSVEGLAAKPIIDIDIVIETKDMLAPVIKGLSAFGYKHRGDLGIKDREAFDEGNSKIRHNLYVCIKDSIAFRNHILLRDRLRKDANARATYSKLKKDLATKHSNSIDHYIDGKTAFILKILSEEGIKQDHLSAIEDANLIKKPE